MFDHKRFVKGLKYHCAKKKLLTANYIKAINQKEIIE